MCKWHPGVDFAVEFFLAHHFRRRGILDPAKAGDLVVCASDNSRAVSPLHAAGVEVPRRAHISSIFNVDMAVVSSQKAEVMRDNERIG